MPITMSNLKSRPVCKVRFKIDAEDAAGAREAYIVGSFNSWNERSHPMKRNKNGSFGLELEFPREQDIQFRYLLDDGRWLNEKEATEYVFCSYAGTDNSVLKL